MSLILDGTNGLSDIDGSAATPAIRGTDANTGIFFPAADTIAFSEGGTEVARFNADSQFVAAAGTAALPVFTTTGDVNTGIFFPAADTIAFSEGGVESVRIDSSSNLSMTGGGTINTPNTFGFKNRIINGAMVIDQRNAGASVTATTAFPYTVDRWQCGGSVNSKFTVQQSTTAPTGFINSALITSSSAYTVGAGEYFLFQQPIEGLNVADLGWGAAGAATVTLSFWVRSSLTGTFGGAVNNSANDRSYPFTYTISVANTYEYKTVTIAGDTSGTWLKTNGIGLQIRFSLGTGTTYSGTAGAWAGTFYASATGATSVVGTNGATFYITGVQLEKGSTATSFDYRPFGTELVLCQRYCCVIPVNASGVGTGIIGPWGANYNATNGRVWYSMPVTMRTTPSVSLTGNQYSIIGVNDVATATNSNFHYSNQMISFDGTSLSSSSVTGQPLNYRGGGLITAEL